MGDHEGPPRHIHSPLAPTIRRIVPSGLYIVVAGEDWKWGWNPGGNPVRGKAIRPCPLHRHFSSLPCTMILLCLPICGGTPCKYFYCQDYISPQNACQTNQIDEVRVGFMQQASRWGEHDRGKPYHYDTTGDCGKSGRPSSEHDRGEKGEHDRGKPYHYYMT